MIPCLVGLDYLYFDALLGKNLSPMSISTHAVLIYIYGSSLRRVMNNSFEILKFSIGTISGGFR